jgi:RNA polymerase sigma-70 factor (ECF subfamily)
VTPSDSNLAHTGNPHETTREIVASLFDTHYQGLCSFVLRYAGDRDAAEEIVQELFLRVWERLESGAPLEQINAPYLYAGARNLAINLAVRRQAENRWRQQAVHQLPHTSLAADAQSNLDELTTIVQRALDRLPQRSRLVFSLSRDQHMTYPEIARVLGVSVKGVEFHMGRALKALREAIE